MVKKKIIIILLMIIIVFGLCVLGYVNREISPETDPYEFTSEKWKNARGGDALERYKMLDDLMEKYDLYSMNRDEIRELLGEGSAESNAIVFFYPIKVEYYDPILLMITFDDDGKVIDVDSRMRG